MMQLKDYQQRTLQALTDYFRACLQFGDAGLAFYAITQQKFGGQGIPYNPVKELPGLPYVCLRLPTGGGKTLVAAHAVAVATQELLHADHPLVLWLTPSNAIRQQTLQALKNPNHPYRQALEAKAGPISVLDITEALYIQPATLNTSTTIIVSTMQAFRVEDTEGRKVYEASGALMSHFGQNLSGLGNLTGLQCYENGAPVTSLANVLRLHRPILIVDEAHNARTGLSFETLARFRPSCILEFTATPDVKESPSNVLHTVSAAELKTEGMIKLPIRLETRPDWQEVISAAVSTRNRLEEAARQERAETGEYIRPILLIQAQPHYAQKASLTVDVLEKHLLNEQRIPAEQIARATGSDRGLEDVDLFDPLCPIRYIITIQALREGWDCSFAYVLCSVAEMHSATAVEQILGRVLRLPQARSKRSSELNRAYAFAASAHFAEAAVALEDALIQNGFEKQEVKDLIVRIEPEQADLGPLFNWKGVREPEIIFVSERPHLETLPPETAAKIEYDPQTRTLVLHDSLQADEVQALKDCFQDAQTQQMIADAAHKVNQRIAQEVNYRPPLAVPLLAVRQGDMWEQFEDAHILSHTWNLAKRDAFLSEREFSPQAIGSERGDIDVDAAGRVHTDFVQQLQTQMAFLAAGQDWKAGDLVSWLDRNIPHIDIPLIESVAFLTQLVERLMADRGFSLAQLVKDKHRLKQAAEVKIHSYRREARQEAYQQCLGPGFSTTVVVRPDVCFIFDPDPMNYPCPPNSLYPNQHRFRKHYYPVVGDFKAKGEEYVCAQFLDRQAEIEVWVRNLEGRPQHSFWLQTSTDRFYPDFVCRLKDGRYLVVEYKGEDRWSNDDSKEKRNIGQVWEERSQGQCLFVMPKGPDFGAIQAKLQKIKC